jgi:hypothetical protein
MDPAKHDITIHQGATFELQIAYKDPSGVPINMSGYTVEGQLWNRLGTSKLANFSPSWTVQESGTFTIGLASSVTSGITENGQYDVMVTEPSGKKSYLLQGNAFIDLGLTGKGL